MNHVIYEQAFPERAWILVKDLEHLVYDIHTVGVNKLGQSETSDLIEFRPKKKPSKNLLVYLYSSLTRIPV